MISFVRLLGVGTGLSRALNWILVGLILAGVVGYIYQEGRSDERQAIEERDREAVDRARDAIRGARDCRDAGRVWDQVRGECRVPVQGASPR